MKQMPECVHGQPWLREGREDLRRMKEALPGLDPSRSPDKGKRGPGEEGERGEEGNQVRDTAAPSLAPSFAVAVKEDVL